jgi:hypothetical protein
MSYYSGSQSDVEDIMRSVGVGTSRTDLLSTADLEGFQSRADSIINNRLSGSYQTPLRQITVSGTTKYPDPIPYVAQVLTTVLIYRAVYTEVEPNLSGAIQTLQDEIDSQIKGLVDGAAVGSNLLRGQRLMARNHFQNPRVAPRRDPGGA